MRHNLALFGASMACLAVASLPGTAFAQSAAPADEAESTPSIIVTARRAALQSADDRKKNSAAMIDSVVADDAGKLPDNSITEVLARVSGVSIVRFSALNDTDHFSVEGSGIQVRGLSGVASRLNGREIFSANSGRSISWGDVTPELMQAVDVYKSSTADQIEGGTGGSIDLRTKLPFDYGYGVHFAGTSEVSMGDLTKKGDFAFSGLVAGKWKTGIGDIGILVDGAYSQLNSRSNFIRMEPYFHQKINSKDYYIPGGFDYGEQQFERKRDGLYAAVQWAPSSSLTFTGIFFQSRYRSESKEWAALVQANNSVVDPSKSVFDANGGLLYSPSVFQRDQTTFQPSGNPYVSGETVGSTKSRTLTQDSSIAFDWKPAGSHFSARGSFQHIIAKSTADQLSLFANINMPTSYALDLRGKLPSITFPSYAQSNYTTPSNYTWAAAMPHDEDNRGLMNAGQLDLMYQFDDGFFKDVKVGGRYANRTERDLNNGYSWAPLGRGWNGSPQQTFADSPAGDFEYHDYGNFFHGALAAQGTLFPSYALTSTVSVADIHTRYGGAPGRTPGFILPRDLATFGTKSLAGYAQVDFGTPIGSSMLSGTAGVRVVNLKNRADGYILLTGQSVVYNGTTVTLPNGATFRSGSAQFTRVLPAINVTLSPSDAVKLRAAYNITMDLPSFTALNASGTLSASTTSNPNDPNAPGVFTGFFGQTGDPLLRPTISNNYDLAVEWYPRPGTSFHASAFYKRLTNLPVYSAGVSQVTINATNGTAVTGAGTFSNYHNAAEAATVKGLEFGGRVFFDQLKGLAKGIGVEANLTLLDSKSPGDTYIDINGVQHNDAPLQGLSKVTYNVALLYEHNPVSLRVAWSWRSKYLQNTNANGTNPTYAYYSSANTSTSISTALPVYGAATGQLDAGIRFTMSPHASFGIQGTNLLNNTVKTLMGGYPGGAVYVRSWFQSDRRVSAGINVSF